MTTNRVRRILWGEACGSQSAAWVAAEYGLVHTKSVAGLVAFLRRVAREYDAVGAVSGAASARKLADQLRRGGLRRHKNYALLPWGSVSLVSTYESQLPYADTLSKEIPYSGTGDWVLVTDYEFLHTDYGAGRGRFTVSSGRGVTLCQGMHSKRSVWDYVRREMMRLQPEGPRIFTAFNASTEEHETAMFVYNRGYRRVVKGKGRSTPLKTAHHHPTT